jgi:hypothetical protein
MRGFARTGGRRAAALLATGIALIGSRDDPLAGRIAGPPVACIDVSRVQGPTIVDDKTILYRESGRRIWRATPIGACGPLRPASTIIVDVYGGQICRNDRFRLLSYGMSIPSAYCRFGNFTPYDKPERP